MRPLRRSLVPIAIVLVFCATVTVTAQRTVVDDAQRGIELYEKNRYLEALPFLQNATKRNMQNADAWHFLGLAYYRLGKTGDAQPALARAHKLRPNFAPYYLRYADLLFRQNNYSEATFEAERAIAVEPENVQAHYILGASALKQNRPDLAIQEAETLLKIQPGHGDALLLKCDAQVAQFLASTEVSLTAAPAPAPYHFLKVAAQTLELYHELYPNQSGLDVRQDLRSALKNYLSYLGPSASETVLSRSEVSAPTFILQKPSPYFPRSASQAGIHGIVKITADFSRDGRVRNVAVTEGLGGGLTEEAMRAARRIEFLPALLNGRPVSQHMVIEYNFMLK